MQQVDTDRDNDTAWQAAIMREYRKPGMFETAGGYFVKMCIFLTCYGVFMFLLFLIIDALRKGGVM